jgi:hypothetical protein
MKDQPMNKFLIRAVSAAAGVVVLSAPMLAHAESNVVTGTGTLNAVGHLDFKITVPKVLFLQVGTGASFTNNTAINLIDFVVPAANAGDGTPIAATAASGDVGNGTVTARVFGNNGAVTLTSTTVGALSNGLGDTVSYGQISAASAVLTSATALAAPALADGATTTTTVPAVAKIVNRDAKWTFSYLNAALVPSGTYGGINSNNGRATYTASMP